MALFTFFEIGVWELKLSMIIHPLLNESRLTWTLNTILKSKCPNLLLAQMKKYSTCLNFSGNIEYPPASYKCTNKQRVSLNYSNHIWSLLCFCYLPLLQEHGMHTMYPTIYGHYNRATNLIQYITNYILNFINNLCQN